MTGDVEKDFKSVQGILEESKIFEEQFVKGAPRLFPKEAPEVRRWANELEFKGEIIRVHFEQNIETGSIYLQNAFVLSRGMRVEVQT